MSRRFQASSWLLAIGLALVTLLYTYGLDRAPAYIGGDEAQFVSHAHAIATTGEDLNGTRLPLFIKITDLLVPNHSSRIWYQPVLFYLLALDFRVLPVNEWTTRLPTTLIAIANIVLVYLVGRRLFADRRIAIVAAAMLALTPAHFIMSRQALDYICPLPVVLAWMLCASAYFETKRPGPLVAGGFLLGLGAYTYISSWLVMPLLAVITLIVARPRLPVAAATMAALGAPMLLVVPWIWAHPEMLTDTLTRYRLPTGSVPGGVDQLQSVSAFNLGERLTVYWDYFNPSFLFFAGGSNPTMATGLVGVFLLPVAVFLAAGAYALVRQRSPIGVLLLVAFVAAPLPIVLTMPDAANYSIARAFTLVPLGILIAAAGCEFAFGQASWWPKAAAVALLVAMPLQFGSFTRDYFSGYQERSAARFDPIATREVMTRVLSLEQTTPAPAILFSDDLDDKSVRWRFYSLKHGREDLWARARDFNATSLDPAALPVNSLLVLYANDPRIARLTATGLLVKVAEVAGLSGEPAAAILRRAG
jgi:4-amino-4-deoxy-L-arabinose transferase-like glycosyltransferase